MAFPPWLCLNCSTRVLVSASPRWMDGCQHDSVTHSPSLCFALFGCILTYSLLLLRLIRHFDSQFPSCLQWFRCPCVCLSLFLPVPFSFLIASLRLLSFFFLFHFPSCRSLPLACAVDCLPEQHVAGGERNKQEWGEGEKKKHADKSAFPRACL